MSQADCTSMHAPSFMSASPLRTCSIRLRANADGVLYCLPSFLTAFLKSLSVLAVGGGVAAAWPHTPELCLDTGAVHRGVHTGTEAKFMLLMPVQLSTSGVLCEALFVRRESVHWPQVSAHGTGATIPPVDEFVVGLKLVTPGKGTISLTREDDPEKFKLANVGLGALGIVSEVTLQLAPMHQLLEHTSVMSAKARLMPSCV